MYNTFYGGVVLELEDVDIRPFRGDPTILGFRKPGGVPR